MKFEETKYVNICDSHLVVILISGYNLLCFQVQLKNVLKRDILTQIMKSVQFWTIFEKEEEEEKKKKKRSIRCSKPNLISDFWDFFETIYSLS